MDATTLPAVLVVEDDASIGRLVAGYLERDGFAPVWVRSGEEALERLVARPVALAIVDVGLPGMDGVELVRELRRRGSTPVVMLTARDEEDDRIAGFAVGADDYVPKPFSPRELMARVHAVLRRAAAPPPVDELVIGDVVVRRAAREVTVGGRPVELRGREFDLLAHLLEHRDRFCDREELLDTVWGLAYPGGTRTVDVHVAALRRKLGRPDLIRTLRGAGYRAIEP
jgi:two-component system, OmpR family, response regulator